MDGWSNCWAEKHVDMSIREHPRLAEMYVGFTGTYIGTRDGSQTWKSKHNHSHIPSIWKHAPYSYRKEVALTNPESKGSMSVSPLTSSGQADLACSGDLWTGEQRLASESWNKSNNFSHVKRGMLARHKQESRFNAQRALRATPALLLGCGSNAYWCNVTNLLRER